MPDLTVISPHCDDAALSLGATLTRLTRAGVRITLISCFTRSKWAPVLPGNLHEREITRIRCEEDVRYVQTLGGSARLRNLDLLDGPLREDWLEYPSDPVAPSLPTNCIADLQRRLAQYVTEETAWAIPLGLEHPDHSIARAAAIAAAGHAPLLLYEDVPYTFWHPENHLRDCVNYLQELAGVCLTGAVLHVCGDIQSWYRGACCYSSQFSRRQIQSMARLIHARGGERVWITPGFESWLSFSQRLQE